MTFTTTAAPAAPNFKSPIAFAQAAFQKAAAWYFLYEKHSRDRIALAHMDDHMLNDIGLTRHDISTGMSAKLPRSLQDMPF